MKTPAPIRMWICGRLCDVFGRIESDYDVGIPAHFDVDHIIVVKGREFTADEHWRLYDDYDIMSCISDAAMEDCTQRQQLSYWEFPQGE